jgi:hypothetical protein
LRNNGVSGYLDFSFEHKLQEFFQFFIGKSEPTLKVAREISRKLDIEASIVLGFQSFSFIW